MYVKLKRPFAPYKMQIELKREEEVRSLRHFRHRTKKIHLNVALDTVHPNHAEKDSLRILDPRHTSCSTIP